jgi:DNA-binding NtrC family response regulator
VATVLYVDDEEPIRRAIRSWLVRRGYTVFTAGSSDEAIPLLETEAIQGVFIDIWLGTESGFDLYDVIGMRWPNVARNAAFVTGDIVRDPEVERALAAIQRPVLSKPFELGELERTILDWTIG